MQWLNYASKYLKNNCPGAGRIDAELLMAHCIDCERADLYCNGLEELAPAEANRYQLMLDRRAKGEPMAYIIGHKEFMGLDFQVKPGVLIPRPETELLVEKALELFRPKKSQVKAGPLPVMIDVGTGSGAIAVSLAVYSKWEKVYAVDVSPAALEIAQQNAVYHGVREKIEFIQGDLLHPLLAIPGLKADLIVANLPYIPSSEIPGLMRDVRDYEPLTALDGGEDGLDYYRRLIPQAYNLLSKGGFLIMEIAPGQGSILKELMENRWKVEITPDLAGRERLVLADKLSRMTGGNT
jgi:release factor glutamine methyltransferase